VRATLCVLITRVATRTRARAISCVHLVDARVACIDARRARATNACARARTNHMTRNARECGGEQVFRDARASRRVELSARVVVHNRRGAAPSGSNSHRRRPVGGRMPFPLNGAADATERASRGFPEKRAEKLVLKSPGGWPGLFCAAAPSGFEPPLPP
jgi:hypothetical protein